MRHAHLSEPLQRLQRWARLRLGLHVKARSHNTSIQVHSAGALMAARVVALALNGVP